MRFYRVNKIEHTVFDDIDELPEPKQGLKQSKSEDDFKKVIQTQKTENQSSDLETSGSLQESIIKKIEQ